MKAKTGFAIALVSTLSLSGCSAIKQKWNSWTESIPEIVIAEVFPPVFPITTPTAKADQKYRLVSIGDSVHLNANKSVTRQPGSLSYHWQVIQKPTGSLTQLSQTDQVESDITIDTSGRYDLQLTVTDSAGNSDTFDMVFSTQTADLPQTSFIAIGDAGTGGPAQFRVAKGIEKLCKNKGCDFVIGTGDNFYPAGVDAVKDSQFESKFEEPYAVVPLPFYMTLGNHDTNSFIRNGDGIYEPLGDVQIAYTRWRNKPSFRFQYPARYYNIEAPIETPQRQPLVEFYALDTTLITSPKDVIPKYRLHEMLNKQGHWLEHEKSTSQAQWQIAYGHHPYISNGEHGNAGNYDNVEEYEIIRDSDSETLKRIKGEYVRQFTDAHICNDMDLYITGHDHNLQYLQPVSDCGITEFIVTGAGARTKPFSNLNLNPSYWQNDNETGFFHIQIIANQMTISAYTVAEDAEEATEQYTRIIRK